MKRWLTKFHRDQSGHLFILTLIMLVVGSLVLTQTLSFMSTGLRAGSTFETITGAYYAADAGVEKAIAYIKNNPALLPLEIAHPIQVPATDVNGHTLAVSVSATDRTHVYKITATATENGQDTRVVTYVSIAPGLFDNAITALGPVNPGTEAGNIYGGGGGIIDSTPIPNQGNIFANGGVRLDSASVKGCVLAAGGTIKVHDAMYPVGPYPAASNATTVDFSEQIAAINASLIAPSKAIAQNVPLAPPSDIPVNIFGDWTPTLASYPGDYHVSGNVNIPNAIVVTFGGKVIVDGNFSTGNASSVIFNGPKLVVGGNFTMNNNTIGSFNCPVWINGSATINASGGGTRDIIFANTVRIGGNLQISPNSASRNFAFTQANDHVHGNVYVGGWLDIIGGNFPINFNGNVYVGGAQVDSHSYILDMGNTGQTTFGGILYVDDARNNDATHNYWSINCTSNKFVTHSNGPIIAKNTITLGSSSGRVDLGDLPIIVSLSQNNNAGGVYITTSVSTLEFSAYIYAPYGEANLGNAKFYGAVTARSIKITGAGVTVTHAFLPLANPNGSTVKVFNWHTT